MADDVSALTPGSSPYERMMAKLVGSSVMGGGVGAPLIGIGAQALTGALSKEGRALRQQTKKDVEALEQGKLGFSEAEKRSMLAGTQRALQAQTAGAEANLRRQAAAAGGFGRSGAQTNALAKLASAQGEQIAKSAGQIEGLSQQTAQQRFGDIMKRLQDSRAEKMKMVGAAAELGAQLPADYLTKKAKAEKKIAGEAEEALPAVTALQRRADEQYVPRYAGDR